MPPALPNQTLTIQCASGTESLDIQRERLPEIALAPQYHPRWQKVLGDLGEDCSMLIARETGLIAGWLMFTVSKSPFGTVVNSLPLLPYGGPAAIDQRVATALLSALVDHSQSLSADMICVATHPLTPDADVNIWKETLGTTHSFSNFVQLQALAEHPLQTMKSRARNSINRKIRRGLDSGLSVRRAETEQDVLSWLDIYRKRYEEIGAACYPNEFFMHAFAETGSSGMSELWLAEDKQQLVGGTWILAGNSCADYFASAFASEFNGRYPSTVVMDAVFTSLLEREIPVLNWQSSPGRGGVYEFKRRWGADESSHAYLTTLLNPESRLLELDPATMQSLFPHRFVVPYSALKSEAED